MPAFNVGDRVRLSAKFLRNTGQHRGSEGHSIWTVVECACPMCGHKTHVATDEHSEWSEGPRHIAVANLKRVGEQDRS